MSRFESTTRTLALFCVVAAAMGTACQSNDCWCGSNMTVAQSECRQANTKYKCTDPGSTSYCAALTPTGLPLFSCFSAVSCGQPTPPPTSPTPAPTPSNHAYLDWIKNFGRDTFVYPPWLLVQMNSCKCAFNGDDPVCLWTRTDPASTSASASDDVVPVKADWRTAKSLDFCSAKQWLLEHMPAFDKHYLPPSVTVRGASMMDDNVAFALMAANATASTFGSRVPVAHQLAYILPYATFHEARNNWRPLMFSKYFGAVADAKTTVEAMQILTSPPYHDGLSINWGAATWPDMPGGAKGIEPEIVWQSSTSPPVVGPFDWLAYGYSSCTGWALTLSYIARAVGIPARVAGTPCWNGGDFKGLATDNENVTLCWHGGASTDAPGGGYLYNHNWVEYFDDQRQDWVFMNVPDTPKPDQGLCTFNQSHGCNWDPKDGCSKAVNNGGPAAAGKDHEIFSVTWTLPEEADPAVDGGAVVDVKNLRLTNGEAVSPLVWSPELTSPSGEPLKNAGLRVVNRSDYYRCHEDAYADQTSDQTHYVYMV